MDKLEKIECKTVETWRNKKTGQTFKTEEAAKMDLEAGPDDIVKDVTVQVSPKGLEVLHKLMK